MIEFKGSHFEQEVILCGVRWYVAYPMSYRQLEEMMEERGVELVPRRIARAGVRNVPQNGDQPAHRFLSNRNRIKNPFHASPLPHFLKCDSPGVDLPKQR
jgi:transposase-like protein